MGERMVRVDLAMTYRLPGSGRAYGPGKDLLVPYLLAKRLGLVTADPKVDSRIVAPTLAIRSAPVLPDAGASAEAETPEPELKKRTRRARSDRGKKRVKKRVKKDTAKAEV